MHEHEGEHVRKMAHRSEYFIVLSGAHLRDLGAAGLPQPGDTLECVRAGFFYRSQYEVFVTEQVGVSRAGAAQSRTAASAGR